MNDKNQERDVYVAIADLSRRKLLRLLADVHHLKQIQEKLKHRGFKIELLPI